MKLVFGLLTMLMALLISAVAAYFSIIGLAALFAAAFIPVVIMGASLEVGKLVAVTWLKVNWRNKNVGFVHKTYLTLAVLVLMLITSVGIYGFLARGHLEQEAPLAGVELQIEGAESRMALIQRDNDRLQGRLDQLDAGIQVFFDEGFATRGLAARAEQKPERDEITTQIEANLDRMLALGDEVLVLRNQIADVSAKLGPLQYVADLLQVNDRTVAVQMIIVLIVFVFDPLAVVLVLSATVTIGEWAAARKARREPPLPPQGAVKPPEPPPASTASEVLDESSPTISKSVALTADDAQLTKPVVSETEMIVALLERNPEFLRTMLEEIAEPESKMPNADVFKTGPWLVEK
jgi:hypothetical protein